MQHQVVARDEWLKARVALLEKEKAFSQARDALSQEQRYRAAIGAQNGRRDHLSRQVRSDRVLARPGAREVHRRERAKCRTAKVASIAP
jgi:hypothetical protein